MRYAFVELDKSGNMLPALYCRACARHLAHAYGGRWDVVLLAEHDDFVCDRCFDTEAPETHVNVSGEVIERDLRALRS